MQVSLLSDKGSTFIFHRIKADESMYYMCMYFVLCSTQCVLCTIFPCYQDYEFGTEIQISIREQKEEKVFKNICL